MAVGTKTEGSIIRPASYCGVRGFEPSFGLFSVTGVLPYTPSLDTVGSFTHRLAHMLLLWEAFGESSPIEDGLIVGMPEPLPKTKSEMHSGRSCTSRVPEIMSLV